MNVKHIYTNQGISLLTLLQKWCIFHEVSYVRIDNEIHFGDFVLFFHDTNDVQNGFISSIPIFSLQSEDAICFDDLFQVCDMDFEQLFCCEEEVPILEILESVDRILSYKAPRFDVKRGFLDPQNMYPMNTRGYPNIRIRRRF